MEGWTGLGEAVPGNWLADQAPVHGLGGTMSTFYRESKAVSQELNEGREVKRWGATKTEVATGIYTGYWLPPTNWENLLDDLNRGTESYERSSDQIRLVRCQGWVTIEWAGEQWSDTGLLASSYNVNTKEYAGVNLQLYMRLKPGVVAGGAGRVADADNTNYPQTFNVGPGGVDREETVWSPVLYKEINNMNTLRVLFNAGAKPQERGVVIDVDKSLAPASWEITQRLDHRSVVVPFDIDCTAFPVVEFDTGENKPTNLVLGLSAYHQPTQTGIDFIDPTVRMCYYVEFVDEVKRPRFY